MKQVFVIDSDLCEEVEKCSYDPLKLEQVCNKSNSCFR